MSKESGDSGTQGQTSYTLHLLRGPLTTQLAKDRQVLLAVSALGISVAWAGLMPRSINWLGLDSGDLNPQGFALMLALVVGYLALAFGANALSDWRQWKWQLRRLSAPTSTAAQSSSNFCEAIRSDGVSLPQAIWDNRVALIRAFSDLCLPLFAAALALYLLYSRAPSTPSVPPANLVSIIGGHESSLRSPTEKTLVLVPTTAAVLINDLSESLATFVIPFKEAGCSGGTAPANWHGIAPDKTHEPFIKSLATDLSACGEENNHVILEVFGFASSSEVRNFRQCSGAESSNVANLKIADERRDAVAKALEKNAGIYLDVVHHDWKGSYQAMEKARIFNDRLLDDHYSLGRGALNRRVEIRLTNAGGCVFPH